MRAGIQVQGCRGPSDHVAAGVEPGGLREVWQIDLSGVHVSAHNGRGPELVVPEVVDDGTNGIVPRFDLAGVNLTTAPKVLIECGNMRNAATPRCS